MFQCREHQLIVSRNFLLFTLRPFHLQIIFILFACRPGLDVPYYFICPYQVVQDNDYIYFKVHSSNQYLYAFNKSNGTVKFREFPTVLDSSHQGTLAYLQSIVANPNFI